MATTPGQLPAALRWRVPMTGRPIDEEHRVATPLELLFDLTFVVAVAQVAAELAHGIADGPRRRLAASRYVMVFFAIWWAWMNFTWFASAYDTDDVPLPAAHPACRWPGCWSSPPASTTRSRTPGLRHRHHRLRHHAGRAGGPVGAGRAQRPRAPGRPRAGTPSGIAVVQVGWAAAAAAAARTSALAGVLRCSPSPSSPCRCGPSGRGMTTWHPHHIAERYGLFTIIVLGECVLAATVALQVVVEDDGWDTDLVLARCRRPGPAVRAVVDVLPQGRRRGPAPPTAAARSCWGYGHYVVFASLAALGAGLEVAVEAARATTSRSSDQRGRAGRSTCRSRCTWSSVWLLHAPLADGYRRQRGPDARAGRRGALAVALLVPLGLPLRWCSSLVAVPAARSWSPPTSTATPPRPRPASAPAGAPPAPARPPRAAGGRLDAEHPAGQAAVATSPTSTDAGQPAATAARRAGRRVGVHPGRRASVRTSRAGAPRAGAARRAARSSPSRDQDVHPGHGHAPYAGQRGPRCPRRPAPWRRRTAARPPRCAGPGPAWCARTARGRPGRRAGGPGRPASGRSRPSRARRRAGSPAASVQPQQPVLVPVRLPDPQRVAAQRSAHRRTTPRRPGRRRRGPGRSPAWPRARAPRSTRRARPAAPGRPARPGRRPPAGRRSPPSRVGLDQQHRAVVEWTACPHPADHQLGLGRGGPARPGASAKTVRCRPPGPSSRAFSDCHGVRVGGATTWRRRGPAGRSPRRSRATSNATRTGPATRRPTSTSSMNAACPASASSRVARPAAEDRHPGAVDR